VIAAALVQITAIKPIQSDFAETSGFGESYASVDSVRVTSEKEPEMARESRRSALNRE
jgi:hypothetical protein